MRILRIADLRLSFGGGLPYEDIENYVCFLQI